MSSIAFAKRLQSAAVLFEKSQTRAIDLTVDQQTDQAVMAQAGSKRQLSLRHIERGLGIAEWTVMEASHVFVRRVAHRGVITINVECAHLAQFRNTTAVGVA